MAKLEFGELDELLLSMEEIAAIPDAVLAEMLNAAGDVVVREQRNTAASMLQGPYNRGAVAAAVRKKKPRRKKDGASLEITFDGTQHGTRLAEIAFINEFGKKGQAARPFVRTANERCAGEATEAQARVYDAWLKGKGL